MPNLYYHIKDRLREICVFFAEKTRLHQLLQRASLKLKISTVFVPSNTVELSTELFY